MKYSIGSGVICRMIAEDYYLIAAGEAVRECPAIQQINAGAAYYWTLLEQNSDTEEVLHEAAARSGQPEDALRPGFERFLEELAANAYIRIFDEEISHNGSGL